MIRKKEDCYKPVRVGNFWSKNYIEHELSTEGNLNKNRLYLKDIINDLNKSDNWTIQLTIPINFISSKDTDEEREMHSKSDNREAMIIDKADEVIKKLFQSLLRRYKIVRNIKERY